MFTVSFARRNFLRVGGLGALALPTLLRAEAAAAPAKGARARSVILVYLGGGLSHHDSFDPKPDAPSEIRGQYKPIPTSGCTSARSCRSWRR